MNYFQFDNWDNGNGDGSGPAFQPGGWTATTNGALWIATAGGTPVINTQDLNLQLDYRPHSDVCVDPQVTGGVPVEQRGRLVRRDCNWLAYPGESLRVRRRDLVGPIPADDRRLTSRYPTPAWASTSCRAPGADARLSGRSADAGRHAVQPLRLDRLYNSFSAAAGAVVDVAISGGIPGWQHFLLD